LTQDSLRRTYHSQKQQTWEKPKLAGCSPNSIFQSFLIPTKHGSHVNSGFQQCKAASDPRVGGRAKENYCCKRFQVGDGLDQLAQLQAFKYLRPQLQSKLTN
jgi:hypothetical protein